MAGRNARTLAQRLQNTLTLTSVLNGRRKLFCCMCGEECLNPSLTNIEREPSTPSQVLLTHVGACSEAFEELTLPVRWPHLRLTDALESKRLRRPIGSRAARKSHSRVRKIIVAHGITPIVDQLDRWDGRAQDKDDNVFFADSALRTELESLWLEGFFKEQ